MARRGATTSIRQAGSGAYESLLSRNDRLGEAKRPARGMKSRTAARMGGSSNDGKATPADERKSRQTFRPPFAATNRAARTCEPSVRALLLICFENADT